jgi:tRNA A37 threonylcarbamoyladenosine synthetase subunit TsaC/SUA5/YrdC
MHKKRSTIGIRVPSVEIPRAIALALGRPMVCMSARSRDEDGEQRFVVDPIEVEARWGERIDAVVDGGFGLENPTTVVDLTTQPFTVLREGQGDVELFV